MYACDVFDIEEIEPMQKVDVYVHILEAAEFAERLRIEAEEKAEKERLEAEMAERLASKAADLADKEFKEAEEAWHLSLMARLQFNRAFSYEYEALLQR